MIACAHCGHPDDAHPVLGGSFGGPGSAKMSSPCTRCDCPGFVSPKRAFMPLEPSRHDRMLNRGMDVVDMHEILMDEAESAGFGGEATHYFWFDDHPSYGFEGKQLMRGISGHEVPGHMRNMMELTDRGDVIFRLRKAS